MNQSVKSLLMEEKKKVGTESLKNPKAFIDCSQTINDIHENLEVYNLTKKRRELKLFDDMIADMESNKKYTREPYSFLVNDTTLSSDNPLRFRKSLL